jgi:hypothetical protein
VADEQITFEQLEADARRRWQFWIDDLAAGRPAPHPHAILEAAAVLGIQHPGAALEAAAAAARARGADAGRGF